MGKWGRGQLGPRHRWTDPDRRCEERCRASIWLKLDLHDNIDTCISAVTTDHSPRWVVTPRVQERDKKGIQSRNAKKLRKKTGLENGNPIY